LQIAGEQIGEDLAAEMRRLGSRPDGELVGDRIVLRQHRAGLDGHAAAAVLPEPFVEDVRRIGEGGIGVAVGETERGGDVRAQIAVGAGAPSSAAARQSDAAGSSSYWIIKAAAASSAI